MSFNSGGVQFPLVTTGNPLQIADPALFHALAFAEAMIRVYAGDALLAFGASARITDPVAYAIPDDPTPYLTEEQVQFPLLAMYPRTMTSARVAREASRAGTTFELVYILPPLTAGDAAQIVPLLRAIERLLENRFDAGNDPSYTPPGAAPGSSVWTAAGVFRASINGASFGTFPGTSDLPMPALIVQVALEERSTYQGDTDTLTVFEGVTANLDLSEDGEPVQPLVVAVADLSAPVISFVHPTTAKNGRILWLEGTFSDRATVAIGGAAAASEWVRDGLLAVVPAVLASGTFSIVVTNPDGRTATIAHTFST